MAETKSVHALVVDDEAVARRMLAFALEQEGFICDAAEDGDRASELLSKSTYDLVVTDLCMPNKHGHSLAVELLASGERPALIVHTSVDDPRMTRDLFTRGVDDIVYKPANYATLAARAKILVKNRRARVPCMSEELPPASNTLAPEAGAGSPAEDERVEQPNNPRGKSRTVDLANVLPISPTALDVYRLATCDDADINQIAGAVEVDASLAAELLVIGNSARYNPAGTKVSDLKDVVVRIGRRRVGELALATSARAGISRNLIDWIDVDLAWRRSMAAGLALQTLVERGGHQRLEQGLFLSAIFHPLGRIVLASVFADRHSQLARDCAENDQPLCVAEAKTFGHSHTETMAELLQQWNIPAEITFPLKKSAGTYRSLQALPQSDFVRVMLVKLSILIGQIVVGRWQGWDLIELPPHEAVRQLGIQSLAEVVTVTRNNLASMLACDGSRTDSTSDHNPEEAHQCGYHKLSPAGFDFLAALFPSLGVEPVFSDLEGRERIIVNCLDVEPSQVADVVSGLENHDILLIGQQHHRSGLSALGTVVPLPASFGAVARCFGTKASPLSV